MMWNSFESLTVLEKSISVGSNTPSLVTVLTWVWLSQIWQRTASPVERLTNVRPTVDETPRDSLTAQIISWDAMLVAVVVGRLVAVLVGACELVCLLVVVRPPKDREEVAGTIGHKVNLSVIILHL